MISQAQENVLNIIENKSPEEIEAFLDNDYPEGFDLNFLDSRGHSPLLCAVMRKDTQTIRKLVQLGAQIDMAGYNGNTPIYLAAQNGDENSIRTLHELGADIQKANRSGYTPLMIAIFYGDNSTINLLDALGADVNAANNDGTTAVHHATKNRDYEMLRTLVSLGADVNAANNDGTTAVHLATKNRDYEMLRTLVSLEADINAANNDGIAAVHLATKDKDYETLRTLAVLGADVNATGSDVNVSNNRGETLLWLAAHDGDINLITLLHALGADVNIPNKNGATPVRIATERGDNDTIVTLHGLGANINIADKNGATPVYFAAEKGNNSTIRLLAGLGADLDTPNNGGYTPLYVAASDNSFTNITTLISEGASSQFILGTVSAAFPEKYEKVKDAVDRGKELRTKYKENEKKEKEDLVGRLIYHVSLDTIGEDGNELTVPQDPLRMFAPAYLDNADIIKVSQLLKPESEEYQETTRLLKAKQDEIFEKISYGEETGDFYVSGKFEYGRLNNMFLRTYSGQESENEMIASNNKRPASPIPEYIEPKRARSSEDVQSQDEPYDPLQPDGPVSSVTSDPLVTKPRHR